MVDINKLLKTIHFTYRKTLGKNINLLIVGGSVGRKNFVHGWSDIDVLLVLNKIDSLNLRLVKKCEQELESLAKIEIDTMIVSKYTIEHTKPRKLHGKIKNFLFFLGKTKVLIKKNIKIPAMSYQDFIYGFWATLADQDKNFLRRNADIFTHTKDKKSLQKLLKKNIKIIFLILKQSLAEPQLAPSTYREVIYLAEKSLPIRIIKQLKKYEEMRAKKEVTIISEEKLREEIDLSVKIFNDITKLLFI